MAKEEKESERDVVRKSIENRNRTEIMKYFLGNPSDASSMNTSMGIELYNQAVEFYEKKEFDMAREALQDSLRYDSRNPLTYELLGDIDYFEQKLDDALKNYEAAFRLKAQEDLKKKILKIQKEKQVESGLATYSAERFIIKYRGEDRGLEGFELRELLQDAYREVGQDFGYFFKQKVPVLLYDEKEFRELSGVPHWSSGLYDGKIRLPAYKSGFTSKELQKIMRHELTHAFVVEMSSGRCPAWLNEGLAEFEEAKVEPTDPRVFRAAIKTNALFPISTFLAQDGILEIKDPLEVQLFYDQAYQLVNYLVERYGMFQIRKMLGLYAEGKDSFEVIQEVFKLSPLELEKRWKETFPQV